MVLIIKPVSAQLTKDFDVFGKSVMILCLYLGSLLCDNYWTIKTKN